LACLIHKNRVPQCASEIRGVAQKMRVVICEQVFVKINM
jgi:hypothetical protein